MNIGVVDYGMGNLHSVAKALATTGANVRVSSDQKRLDANDALVLPGVGAFGAAMKNLEKNGLDDFVREWLAKDKPFLGICLGLQMLFEGSDESRGVEGLGAMKGRVRAFRPKDFRSKSFRIPHMGWNTLEMEQSNAWGIKKSDSFYFVHTYFPEPKDDSVVLTTTQYGRSFCSSVARGNTVATQFHPEKSGDVGLRLFKKRRIPLESFVMIVIPAIDLYGGQCVRLRHGKLEEKTVYSDDPVAMAKQWVEAGATRLHVVDLDGAFTGEPKNLDWVIRIKEATKVTVQMGGGLRSMDLIDRILKSGIDRVVLGTIVMEEAGLAKTAFQRYQTRIMVALDVKDGKVAVRGWKDDSGVPAMEALSIVEKLGATEVIYTDISRDGTLEGVNLKAFSDMINATGLTIVASGGVTTLQDIVRLKTLGASACIVGKAIYEGKIKLSEAIALAQN